MNEWRHWAFYLQLWCGGLVWADCPCRGHIFASLKIKGFSKKIWCKITYCSICSITYHTNLNCPCFNPPLQLEEFSLPEEETGWETGTISVFWSTLQSLTWHHVWFRKGELYGLEVLNLGKCQAKMFGCRLQQWNLWPHALEFHCTERDINNFQGTAQHKIPRMCKYWRKSWKQCCYTVATFNHQYPWLI